MKLQLNAFFEPADFIRWYKERKSSLILSEHVLTLLVNYMEGHDYVLASDAKNVLYQVDRVEGGSDRVSLTDVLTTVIQWNDSLIEHTKELLLEDITSEEQDSLEKYLSSLTAEESALMGAWESIPDNIKWRGEEVIC